jgi:hypothetical protein
MTDRRRKNYTPKTLLTIGLFLFLGLVVIPAMASDGFVNNGDGNK